MECLACVGIHFQVSDLGKAVQQLKRESGKGLFVAGMKLPMILSSPFESDCAYDLSLFVPSDPSRLREEMAGEWQRLCSRSRNCSRQYEVDP